MNLFGIGPLETVAIVLIAFLALGPRKSIEAARTVGKVIRDLRRTLNETISAVNLDLTESSSNSPPSHTTPSKEDRAENDQT